MGRQAALCAAFASDTLIMVRTAPGDRGCHQHAVIETFLLLMLAIVHQQIQVLCQAEWRLHCLQGLSQTGGCLALGFRWCVIS